MGMNNIATMFAPNLLKQKGENSVEMATSTPITAGLVVSVLSNIDFMFCPSLYCIVNKSFHGEDSNHLTLQKDALIKVLDEGAKLGNWFGSYGNTEGFFPFSHTSLLYFDNAKPKPIHLDGIQQTNQFVLCTKQQLLYTIDQTVQDIIQAQLESDSLDTIQSKLNTQIEILQNQQNLSKVDDKRVILRNQMGEKTVETLSFQITESLNHFKAVEKTRQECKPFDLKELTDEFESLRKLLNEPLIKKTQSPHQPEGNIKTSFQVNAILEEFLVVWEKRTQMECEADQLIKKIIACLESLQITIK